MILLGRRAFWHCRHIGRPTGVLSSKTRYGFNWHGSGSDAISAELALPTQDIRTKTWISQVCFEIQVMESRARGCFSEMVEVLVGVGAERHGFGPKTSSVIEPMAGLLQPLIRGLEPCSRILHRGETFLPSS